MGQEPGNGLAGWFWLKVSYELALKLSGVGLGWGAVTEGSLTRCWQTQFLSGYWLGISVLHPVGLSTGGLTVFLTGQLAFPTANDPRESTS